MRYAFLLNPAARNGRAGRCRPALEDALRAEGAAFSLAETTAPGHAERLAREAAAAHDVVVAVGGDGTIHEVARGVYGTGAAMGVLPLGTGNDYAHAVGMPDDLHEAVRALLGAEAERVDLGRVRWQEQTGDVRTTHEALFANGLGVGFDALAALGAQRFKFLGGRTAYLAAVLRALRAWRQPEVEIRASMTVRRPEPVAPGEGAEHGAEAEPFGIPEGEGEALHAGRFFLVEVGNGFSVGGGFLLTPDAVVDDGLLDVCVVGQVSMRRVLQVLPKAFTGAHVTEPEVTMRRVRRLTIRSSAPLPVHADGENLTTGARALDVAVLPGVLSVLAPKIRRSEPLA